MNTPQEVAVWSKEWPKVPGWYWFYGWYKGEQPRHFMLRPMEVRTISNGLMYSGWGTIIYASEFEHAEFLPLTPPTLPQDSA